MLTTPASLCLTGTFDTTVHSTRGFHTGHDLSVWCGAVPGRHSRRHGEKQALLWGRNLGQYLNKQENLGEMGSCNQFLLVGKHWLDKLQDESTHPMASVENGKMDGTEGIIECKARPVRCSSCTRPKPCAKLHHKEKSVQRPAAEYLCTEQCPYFCLEFAGVSSFGCPHLSAASHTG